MINILKKTKGIGNEKNIALICILSIYATIMDEN
jgi:hypothetical protein